MSASVGNVQIPCCIDVPEEYTPGARYALRMLLYPFRVKPLWVTPDRLGNGGIYYGVDQDNAPEAAWRICVLASTLDFFSGVSQDPPSLRLVSIGDDEVPVLFESGGDGPFDLVAATFFLLSGWQERTSVQRDRHGRFLFGGSLHDRLGIAGLPVVELYRMCVATRLRKIGFKVESKSWGVADWAFCSTHDIDYIRKWRPGIVYREIVQRGILNQSRESVATRVGRIGEALTGMLSPSDPYRRAIRRIRKEVSGRSGTATFFFKVAARDPHDVKYSSSSTFLQHEYAELRSGGFEIGLHPSYHAFNHGAYLAEERSNLALSSGIKAISVRTHYLRFDLSSTPRLLEKSGFRIDSSLGFADHEGFRNGTCKPFQLFDLHANRALDIWEMPLTVMESTLFNRQHLSLEEARGRTFDLMETCRRFGGVFVGLWHNTLWDESDCPGWGEHFTSSLDRAMETKAGIMSLSAAMDSWD